MIVLCLPVSQGDCPVSFAMVDCAGCGTRLWLSPEGKRQAESDGTPADPRCVACLPPQIAFLPPSDEVKAATNRALGELGSRTRHRRART